MFKIFKIRFKTDPYRDYDAFRLPLIYPYELVAADQLNPNDWSLPEYINNIEFEGLIFNEVSVDSVGIKNKFILLYTHAHSVPSKNGRYAIWLIYDTEKKKGSYFINRKEFDNYLIKNNSSNYKLYTPEKLFNIFKSGKNLPDDWKLKIWQF